MQKQLAAERDKKEIRRSTNETVAALKRALVERGYVLSSTAVENGFRLRLESDVGENGGSLRLQMHHRDFTACWHFLGDCSRKVFQ